MPYTVGSEITAGLFTHVTASGTGLLTAASGYTDNGSYGVRWGPLVHLELFINSTAAITATSGNVTDVTLATLTSGWYPIPGQIGALVGNGSVVGEGVVTEAGLVRLRALSDSITAGTNLRFSVTWLDVPA